MAKDRKTILKDITLYSTNDLIDELINRFEHAIFAGMQTAVHSKEDIIIKRQWKGNNTTCCSLVSELQFYINHQADENSREYED